MQLKNSLVIPGRDRHRNPVTASVRRPRLRNRSALLLAVSVPLMLASACASQPRENSDCTVYAAFLGYTKDPYASAQQHLGMIDRALADHADIERIAIAALAAFGELPHPLAAIGLGDEAIERGRL